MDSPSATSPVPSYREQLPGYAGRLVALFEVAAGHHPFLQNHLNDEVEMFVRGFVDYWWDDHLEEPTWEMIVGGRGLRGEQLQHKWPSAKRFHYQYGAILAYKLKEKYVA